MNANILQIISITAFVIAGVLFIAAMVCFFAFGIPAIMGELSGKTAAKKVQEIREQNRRERRKSLVAEYQKPVAVQPESAETEVLQETEILQETTVLSEPQLTKVKVLQSEMEIHSNEII